MLGFVAIEIKVGMQWCIADHLGASGGISQKVQLSPTILPTLDYWPRGIQSYTVNQFCLSACLPVCLSACMSVCLYVCLSIEI